MINTLHTFLFCFLLVLLPTQLGKHFWPEWSFVHGIRVDYLSPTLFLTDIVLLFLLLFWFLDKPLSFKNISRRKIRRFFLFLVFLLISSFLADKPILSLYKTVRLVEFCLFGFYVSRNVVSKKQFALVVFFLSLGVFWSSVLAWAQFLSQSSLSALYSSTHPLFYLSLQFLGERTFDIATPGIAKAALNSRLVLRPYAVFPHPNALAGFIVVVFALVLANLRILIKKQRQSLIINHLSFIVVALATLFISFSRSAWIVLLLFTIYYLLFRERKAVLAFFKKFKILSCLLVFVSLLVLCRFLPVVLQHFAVLKTDDFLSVSRRVELNKAAFAMIKASPVFGVGLGNFISRLFDFSQNREVVYWFQPVHNIFLLVAAETGLIGLGVFLYFLFRTYKHLLIKSIINHQSLAIALSSVLALGLFDHYFLTLQQTQLLFALILGLCWARCRH